RKTGVSVRVDSFDAATPHGRLPMANIVGAVPGRRKDVILIGGHYDTKWFRDLAFVGANDGGSSAAFLIELARRLQARPREYTYWVVWFDGEEARETWTATDSLYGSRRMAGALDKGSAQSLEVVGKVLLDALPGIEEGLNRSRGGRP